MHTPSKTYTLEEAKRSLERYCAYQERCHQEVNSKLGRMGMIPEAVDVIIGHLITHNFLNETRFAQAFARGKFRSKAWGKQRIVRELKFRKISAYNIKKALEEIPDTDYEETFEKLSQKRLNQLTLETDLYKKRKKFIDYLLYRGWETHRVYAQAMDLIQ